ncbi:MAG: Wzt carbohydrate-binding domain-containing protein [Alphaproteobacteria bacterium]
MSAPAQLSDGKARLLDAGLRDVDGADLLVASQGQAIEVVATFEALADLGHPGSGLELRDATGSMLHGTSTYLHETQLAPALRAGGRVTFRHRLTLDVLPGDYAIIVAMATVALDVAYRDASVGHDEFFAHVTEHCRLEAPLALTVLSHRRGKLDHYGLVGLAGSATTSVEFDE